MVRGSFVDKNGIRKGIWTQEEDHLLRAYVHKYGHSNWRLLPKFAGLSRCGKSCRLRWMNYLRPGLKRGNYSKQEEDLIIQLHKQFGNKWSRIAAKLPARSDNEIKNYWHTNLKKKKRDECESSGRLEEKYSSENRKQVTTMIGGREYEKAKTNIIHSPPILESSSLLISKSSCEDSNLSCDSAISNSNWTTSFQTFQDSCDELDFWTQPFVREDAIMSTPYFPNYEDSLDLFYQVMQDFPPN